MSNTNTLPVPNRLAVASAILVVLTLVSLVIANNKVQAAACMSPKVSAQPTLSVVI